MWFRIISISFHPSLNSVSRTTTPDPSPRSQATSDRLQGYFFFPRYFWFIHWIIRVLRFSNGSFHSVMESQIFQIHPSFGNCLCPPPPSTCRKVNCSGAQWTASCVHQSWTHGIIWFGERMDINIRSRSLTPLPWWGQDKAFIPNLRVQLQLWQVLIYISSKLLRDPHLYFLCSLSFLE